MLNIGIIKSQLGKSLVESYSTDDALQANDKFNEFISVIKDSPILSTEYFVFSNLENKYITENNLAIKYIDNNVSLLKKYNKDDIIKENEKLNAFVSDYIVDQKKKTLYENIQNLIFESCENEFPNIDLIHESFEKILEHLKIEKKQSINESKLDQTRLKDYFSNQLFLELAIKKFNNKYSNTHTLDESTKNMLKILINNNSEEKESFFESLKKETKNILKNKLDSNDYDEDLVSKLNGSIEKIDSMVYSEGSLIDNFIKLNNFKESLNK